MLSKLVPEILFSCDGYCFNVFAVQSYYAACHCNLDCIVSMVMFVITCTNNYSTGLQYPILLLNHFSRSYQKETIISGSIIILIVSYLSLDQCFIIVIIIISVNWYPIYYWHNALYWMLE